MESETLMKKNVNARKAQVLKLSRETILNLEKGNLKAVAGGDPNFSVKFCTELGCPTDTCPAASTAGC
jgi:DNA-binding XRE family transcriptional regulator